MLLNISIGCLVEAQVWIIADNFIHISDGHDGLDDRWLRTKQTLIFELFLLMY